MLGQSGHLHEFAGAVRARGGARAVAIIFDADDRLSYDEFRAKAPLEMQAYEEWLGKIRDSKEATAPFLRRKSRGAGSQSHEQ